MGRAYHFTFFKGCLWQIFLSPFLNSAEVYSEPCQSSKIECYAKIVNGWQQLTIFAKHSILDFCHSSGYASAVPW